MSASFELVLMNNCRRLLLDNPNITPQQCLHYMNKMSHYEKSGAMQCNESDSNLTLARVAHNPYFFSSECGNVEIQLLKYVLPPLMLLCFFGNMLNLLIYSLSYFDGSSSVHFLRAKAIFNIIFVSSRLLEVTHAWSGEASSWLEPLFWYTRSYIMTISNISGTMSTWLTLMVTVETVMCVLLPFVFRQYCTKRLTWSFLCISLTIATIIHSTLVFTTQISVNPKITLHQVDSGACWYVQEYYVLTKPENHLYSVARQIYFWVQNAVAIVIPTIAMLICSILIVKQFTFKELGEAFSTRRKCVIRMTVATTVSHLLLEGPATLTHAAAAMKGDSPNKQDYLMCVLNHGNNLLSIVNATIPFFVFMMCNEQFRHMTAMYIKAYTQTDKAQRKTYLSKAGMRCSRVSRINDDNAMNKLWVKILLISCFLGGWTTAVHITGNWDTGEERIKIIAKFGFQETSKLRGANTRGFVFGNITSNVDLDNSTHPVLLSLVPQSQISYLHSDSSYGSSCGVIMKNLSQMAYESACFTKGQQDLFRWLPCPSNELCVDETDPSKVLPTFQFTMQVEEPATAEYWYIVLVACRLNSMCNWTSSDVKIQIDYDIWLTNGKPHSDEDSLFSTQFSFDEQNTIEIYVLTLLAYLILGIIQKRALSLCKNTAPPPRLRLLSYIIGLKITGVILQTLNVLSFAFDGQGMGIARFFGEVFRLISIDLLCLLLVLLSRGWGLSPRSHTSSPCCIAFCTILGSAHLILFFCNSVFVYDAMHEVDVFNSWPGYGMLVVRIIFALWFLVEIRSLILREQNEERAVFLAHVGAGFLVWLVYLPGLGIIASFISELWRFKIILAITSLANFTAITCLLHLFWPIGSYRKFFQDDLNFHRRITRTESHEMQDFERLLFESSDSDCDYPEMDPVRNLHSI